MTTCSSVPPIWKPDGRAYYGPDYTFVPGRDEVIRQATTAWVVSYGEMLHRCLDAVDKLREEGFDIGLVNKPHINCVDEDALARIGKSGLIVVVESQNRKTGLGVRLGTALIERGYSPNYRHFGVTREGCGGLGEQIIHQGLDSHSVYHELKSALS